MLETLQVYLQKGQDRRQAARALHVHPNTLDYRLRRIRELTGLSPTVPHDIQTLCAAITAWKLTYPAEIRLVTP
jgi:DNA-binding PucR family transcriptional regulator